MRTRTYEATRSGRLWIPIIQCAWCKGVKVGRWYLRLPGSRLFRWQLWLRLPQMPVVAVGVTHAVCPHCAGRVSEAARRGRLARQRTGCLETRFLSDPEAARVEAEGATAEQDVASRR